MHDYLHPCPEDAQLESASVRPLRLLLGVHRRTNVAAVFAELGRLSMEGRRMLLRLLFFERLLGLPGDYATRESTSATAAI